MKVKTLLQSFALALAVFMVPVAGSSCQSIREAIFEPAGTIHIENIRGVGVHVTERTRIYVQNDLSLQPVEEQSLLAQLDLFAEYLLGDTSTGWGLVNSAGGILDMHDAYLHGDTFLSANGLAVRLEDSKVLREVIARATQP